LGVREQRRLEDDLELRTAAVAQLRERGELALDERILAGLERADVLDDIELARTVLERAARFAELCRGRHRAQREADDRTDRHAGACEPLGRTAHPAAVDA